DAREAAARSPEIRRLPLVQSCSRPLHRSCIDVAAQIELQRRRHALRADGPFPGPHDLLRDVVAGDDVLPDALRELVAAIRGAASESGSGLEEKLPSTAP